MAIWTQRGQYYRNILLDGMDTGDTLVNNAAALDAEFANSDYLTDFTDMLALPYMCGQLIASSNARAILARSSIALGLLLTNHADEAMANASFVTLLNSLVNDGTTFIKRTLITASGNWAVPSAGLEAAYYLGHGPGGAGGQAGASYSGGGGQGGELVGRLLTKLELPAGSSNVAIVIPASGSPTTIGALVSAASGATGSSDGSAASSGGTTSGGGSASLSQIAMDTAAWHKASFHQKGADGVAGRNTTGTGANGAASWYGGNGGTGANDTTSTGAGSAYGGGGAAGGCTTSMGGGGAAGLSASNNTGAGGGGGSKRIGVTPLGGAGGTGKVWIYYVQKR